MNMFGNQQIMPQQYQQLQSYSQYQNFQPSNTWPQFGGNYYNRMSEQNFPGFTPLTGTQSGFAAPAGLGRVMNGPGGNPQGVFGSQGTPGWGWPQNAGAQGYSAPGYPPRGFSQQQTTPSAQGYPSQGFLSQGYPQHGYVPQGYPQGYGTQMPVYPGWGEPPKGGLKGFISNLMAKRKR